MLNRLFSLPLLFLISSFVSADEIKTGVAWSDIVEAGSSTAFTITDEVTVQCVTFAAENTAMQSKPRCAYLRAGEYMAEMALPFSHDVKHAEKAGEQVVLYVSSHRCSNAVAFDFAQFQLEMIDPAVPFEPESVTEMNCWR